jgi:hypothetical protein
VLKVLRRGGLLTVSSVISGAACSGESSSLPLGVGVRASEQTRLRALSIERL